MSVTAIEMDARVSVRASDTRAGSSDRHILILDDMPLVRKQLGRIAKRAGLHAVLCGTIPEALAAASQTRFDAAIIDYQLQGATGDDALLQLRGLQPSLRAILCTGYAGSQDFADLPVVFDAVVHKPFRPADLTKTLFAVLDREVREDLDVDAVGEVRQREVVLDPGGKDVQLDEGGVEDMTERVLQLVTRRVAEA